MPGRLRIADIDQDSYPDIAMTARFKESSTGKVISITGVMLNTAANTTDTQRYMAAPTEEFYDMLTTTAGETGMLVTYADIDEDGRLDFIL